MTVAGRILVASLPLLIGLYVKRDLEQDKLKAFPNDPQDYNLPVKETFDFIVGKTNKCTNNSFGFYFIFSSILPSLRPEHENNRIFWHLKLITVGGGGSGCVLARRSV